MDTFQEITPYFFEGTQTVSSSFHIEDIQFKVSLSIESRKTQDIMDHRERELSRTKTKTESLDLIFGFRDVKFYGAVFLAIIEEKLMDLQLGSIFDLQNAIGCLNQVLVDIAIGQLEFSISGWDVRIEEGQGSFFTQNPEIIRALKNSHEELVSLFQDNVTGSMPFIADKIIRPLLNKLLQDFVLKPNTCKYLSSKGEEGEGEGELSGTQDSNNIAAQQALQQEVDLSMYVDLRDLFLNQEDSRKIGGSGDMPYGDLWFILASAVRDNIIAPNPEDNNSPKVNAQVIDSFTYEQSGTKGQIIYPDPLIEAPLDIALVTTDNEGVLTFKLFYNNFFENLSSFTYPLTLVDPKGAFEHRNILSIGGPQEGSIKGKTYLSMNLTYPNNDETTTSSSSYFVELALDMEVSGIQLDLLILTKVLTKRLMEFPLVDFNNIDCWLATIPAPELNEFGVRSDWNNITSKKADRTFGILDIKSHVDNTKFRLRCTNCDEPFRDVTPNYPGKFYLYIIILYVKCRLCVILTTFQSSHYMKYNTLFR